MSASSSIAECQDLLRDIDEAIEQHKFQNLISLKYYKPTDKMMLFYKAGLEARERLILGGNRTGKTYGVEIEMYYHLTGFYPDWWCGYRFNRPIEAIVASQRLTDTRNILQKKLFKGDVQDDIPPIIHESLIVDTKNTNIAGAYDYADIQHVSGESSRLYFKAFKQGANFFQGVKADWIHLDESVGYDVYQEALYRTTSFNDSKTFLTVTQWPEKGMDELVRHFMNNADADTVHNEKFYMHMSWADNIYLSEEEKARLRNSTPAWQIEAREHGYPVFGQGKVFIQPESDIFIPPFQVPDHFHHIYGLDPAATSGGTYGSVHLAWDKDRDMIYAVSDYKLSNVTPSEHANNIRNRIVPFEHCIGICDPAGGGENQHTKESTLDFFRNKCGLKLVNAVKVNGTKEAVIDSLYERIRNGTFKIMFDNTGGCVNLVKEWRQYSRDDKGQIIKKNDHCIDALFYGFNGIHMSNKKNIIKQNISSGYGAPSGTFMQF